MSSTSSDPERIALIALGSNLGDSIRLINDAIKHLESHSTRPPVRSSLWRSRPVDCPPGSPDFVNAAIVLFPHSAETPETLLRKLQEIEQRFGRRPKQELNEARPLDLDLIAFGNETRNCPALVLPHPRAHVRRFVLEPLAEIVPDFKLPGQPQSIGGLLSEMPAAGIERIKS
jgi:2-amino-4-hydroxy-6-hydroxymethyldihydropteridine diphosphokinase